MIELRGDEALAVFTSARAALRSAIELQAVYADETQIDPKLPLTAGIGMDAGEAVPVEGGYRGAALNLGARLNKHASVGEVLVSPGLAHLVGVVDGVRLEEQGVASFKGVSAPVKVFKAVGEIPAPELTFVKPQEIPLAVQILAPMIGREVELRRLCWTWRLCRRRPGVVHAVMGPTGIGKTRLLAELAAVVARSGGGYVTYRSLATEQGWAQDAQGPVLVILDDLDLVSAEDLRAIEATLRATTGAPAYVCLALDEERASPQTLGAVRKLAAGSDSVMRLPPLDLDQMVRLATLYLGSAVDTMPREVLASTGGVPRRVHEEVGRWAYEHATRRLGKLALQAAAGRDDLRTVEADLAGTVIDLQVVRDQSRLFGLTPGRLLPETARSPYLGLASFQAEDAEFFFGRERLVAEMAAKLAGSSCLAVVGPSGSGKSSVVRAGLIPALAVGGLPGSEAWKVVLLRPGEHPLRSLDRALWGALPRHIADRLGAAERPLAALAELGDSDQIVLVVDQLEEVFTMCADEAERSRFLASLAEAASNAEGRMAVIAVIRADYYGRFAEHPALAQLLATDQVLVGSMNAEEYRRVIVQPAARAGVQVEPELADALVADVLGEPGALPLLSATLLELWGALDGRTMRQQAYIASGGLQGAVARLAESVYESLDEAQRAVARRIFLRLAGPGEGDLVVRRRVALSELDAERDKNVAHVLDALTSGRLLTKSEGTVEVAHEALLREWPRLQGWLEEDREGRRLHAHLTASAQEWASRKRDPAELYRGARLSAALDWTAEHNKDLNQVEKEFVKASRAATQRELVRLRGLLAGVALLLVAAIVAGSVAFVQRQSAVTSARQALARQLGAEALATPRMDQAMLLARQAVMFDRSTQTESNLFATLLHNPAAVGTFALPIGVRPRWTVLSPDGRTLAVQDNSGLIDFFDTRTYQQSQKPLIDYGLTNPSTIGFAGPYFFAPHTPGSSPLGGQWTLDIFDAGSMRLVRRLGFSDKWINLGTGQFNPVLGDARGERLYFPWDLINNDGSDGAAYIDSWNAATGELTEFPVGSNGMNGAAIIAGDRLMVVTDSAAVTFDAETMQRIASIPVHLSSSLVSISPDGEKLAASTLQPISRVGAYTATFQASNNFDLIDLKHGLTTPINGVHTAPIETVSFSPDGRFIATGSDDHTAIVWDAATGSVVDVLTGHSGKVNSLAFTPVAGPLFTASSDGVVFEWDLSGTRAFGRTFNASVAGPLVDRQVPPPLAISPDGSHFAVRIAPSKIGIFSVASLQFEQTVTLPPGIDVWSMAWSKNQVLAVGADTGIQLWDVGGSALQRQTLQGVAGTAYGLAFAADGSMVAAVTQIPQPPPSQKAPDGWLGVWDFPSGHLRFSQHLHNGGSSVAFDPRAPLLAVGPDFGVRIPIYDVGSGTVRQTVSVIAPVLGVAFRSDGTLLTGSWPGIVQHWDPATGHELAHQVQTEGVAVSSISISPDQSMFATSGATGGGVKLWDEATLQQFGATLPRGYNTWSVAAFTPDGAHLLVIYADGSGSIWPVTLSAWMDHACEVAHRNFTHEEWSRFVPTYAYQRTCPQYPPGR